MDTRFLSENFPRASAYHPEWVLSGVSGGANPLWLTEWLTSTLQLKSGMRILDLGCGRALSSIFLNREFGVQVWATDRLTRELEGELPKHLQSWWEPGMACLHSAAWWRDHWQRTGLVEVELADDMPDGWRAWLEWQRIISPDNLTEIASIEADAGRYLTYVRTIGRRRLDDAKLEEPIVSIPSQYNKQPLLRD